jgi:deoxyadenosine/deoxycytidine kinase
MHIAIAGNIGAGKTTLTNLLAKHFKWEPQFEEVITNPYLDDFYTQMERWSFNLQIYFLNTRLFMKMHSYLLPTYTIWVL